MEITSFKIGKSTFNKLSADAQAIIHQTLKLKSSKLSNNQRIDETVIKMLNNCNLENINLNKNPIAIYNKALGSISSKKI